MVKAKLIHVFLFALLHLFMFVYQSVLESDKDVFIIIALSFFKAIIAYSFIYVSSVWLSKVEYLKNNLLILTILFIVALVSLFAPNFYNHHPLFDDPMIFGLTIIYVFLYLSFGVRLSKVISRGLVDRLGENEVNKVFLSVPPKDVFDFMIFYLFILCCIAMPFLALAIH